MKRTIITMPRTLKTAITLSAVFISVMTAQQMAAQGLLVTGYADLEVISTDPGGDNSELYFDNHHFNVVALGEIYGNLFAGCEIEFEHAGEEIALEYGYLGYTGLKNLRIMAGKFIVPFGRFNKDLHPAWINKMADQPLGFRDIFPQTYSDVGIWLSGAIPFQKGARVTYDAFVVNGLMGADSSGIRGMRDNDRDIFPGGGRDDNKAVGGRLGLELATQGFDIGASIYNGRYSNDDNQDLNLTLVGVDAAFRKSGFEIRAEMVQANQEISGGEFKKTGGYAQAAYLIKSRYEPVVRFSTRNMPGESQDKSRLSFGLNFYVSAAAAIRLNYHINTEKSDFKSDNDVLIAQFTTSF